MVSERRDEAGLSVLGLLRVKVSGSGNASIGDGYAEDLQLQTS
jgi:hypothetical protein